MREHQLAAMKIVAADPNVDGFISFIGAGAPLNNGRMFMRLKDALAAEVEREPDHPGTAPEIRAVDAGH
jgi:hypothetical protein